MRFGHFSANEENWLGKDPPVYNSCDGIEGLSPSWASCYNFDQNCEEYNGCSNYLCIKSENVTFYEWMDCMNKTNLGGEACGDTDGGYEDCFEWGEYGDECEKIGVSEYFYGCYWNSIDCLRYNGCLTYDCIENDVTFLDWLDCYLEPNIFPADRRWFTDSRNDSVACGDVSGLYY